MAKKADAVPFERTQILFNALVSVETHAHLFAREIEITQRLFNDDPPPRDAWYVAPPEDNELDDLKGMINDRRKERPEHHRRYWDRLDQYHRMQRYWRSSLQDAKVAADCATFELSPPETPPLDRVSTAIKRTLQQMGGLVTPPMYIGDGPPQEKELDKRLMEKRVEVSNWIDELRLLLHPRSLAAVFDLRPRDVPVEMDGCETPISTEKGDAPVAAPVDREVAPPTVLRDEPSRDDDGSLHADDYAIFEALEKNGAIGPGRYQSVSSTFEDAFGPDGESEYADRCARLVNRGYLISKTGRRGGHALADDGCRAWSAEKERRSRRNTPIRTETPRINPPG